jgi:hypothetical protein
MLPGTEHAVSPRRSAAFRDQIISWWDDEDAAGALALLPEWIRWNGEQAGLPPDLISDPVAIAERRPEDADEPWAARTFQGPDDGLDALPQRLREAPGHPKTPVAMVVERPGDAAG